MLLIPSIASIYMPINYSKFCGFICFEIVTFSSQRGCRLLVPHNLAFRVYFASVKLQVSRYIILRRSPLLEFGKATIPSLVAIIIRLRIQKQLPRRDLLADSTDLAALLKEPKAVTLFAIVIAAAVGIAVLGLGYLSQYFFGRNW